MGVYTFETITAEQALGINIRDSLSVSIGSAKTTTILFLDDGTISMSVADRTVIFGPYLSTLSPTVRYPDGSQLFVGRPIADVYSQEGRFPTGAMYGGDGSDSLTGGPGDWLIQGNQGDDRIVVSSAGSNVVYGGQGNDNLGTMTNKGVGQQYLQGNKGNDRLQGGDQGTDTLLGGQGNDSILSGGGSDFMNGNLGDDLLEGGGRLFGEGGDDTLRMDGGVATTASGGEGDDRIIAGNATGVAQSNLLQGDAGNDTLIGSGGVETLSGGAGVDQLSGGAGADVFVASSAGTLTAAAADRIIDWGSDDVLLLRASVGSAYVEISALDFDVALQVAQARITGGQIEVVAAQVGDDVVVFADAGPGAMVDSITLLVGRSLADISAANFA